MIPPESQQNAMGKQYASCGRMSRFGLVFLFVVALATGPILATAAEAPATVQTPSLARQATIYRDAYGVPHIRGETDEACAFAFAYCQAEDNFWQLEDSFAIVLGRYAELDGQKQLHHDLLNRAFEIPERSKKDFDGLSDDIRSLCAAFTSGLNYYLATHPDVKPRMFDHFEPWYLLAFERGVMLNRLYPHTGAPPRELGRLSAEISKRTGSNAWAIGSSRTRSGRPMLLVNPHSPYFGYGQFYEGHLISGEGWNFSGATFFGSPLPSFGHNEHCGWAFTVNEPNTSDSWIETFDDPDHRLNYRYGDGYRTAAEWTDTIRIRTKRGIKEKRFTFRKTHHGPVVKKLGGGKYLSAMIDRFYDTFFVRQNLKLVRSTGLAQFREAMATLDLHYFNAVYADRDGNIYYAYNGIVPRRKPGFDWTHPLDGSNPDTDWQGYHTFAQLPQIVNPLSDFVQSCNSTPFTTTDDGNPFREDFSDDMFRDQFHDNRRAHLSRYLLRQMHDVTLDDWQRAAFGTTIYWALIEMPRYRRRFQALKSTNPTLAARVRPYVEHLLDWNCRGGLDSTQATLCLAWYEQLYGFGYPAETLKPEYVGNVETQFEALVAAAEVLKKDYGTWKIPWGRIHRLQRHANRSVTGMTDMAFIPFSDKRPSLPTAGLPSPPGASFVTFYTPSRMPLKAVQKQYAVVGSSYMAAIEFTDRIKSRTVVQFGASGDPNSPHFFDQAKLMSERRLKPAPFYLDEVKAAAREIYHPGDQPTGRTAAR